VAAVLDRPPLVVLFTGSGGQGDAIAARLVERLGAVVLATSAAAGAEAHAALVWAADHAAELDADPGRLAVVGVGTGTEAAQRVAALAGADGWPLLLRVVLVRPGKDDEGDSACALDHLADALDTARLPTMEDR
jgi:acetyl esterase